MLNFLRKNAPIPKIQEELAFQLYMALLTEV